MLQLLRASVLLALTLACSAQEAKRRQPKFTLPAGTHALDELVDRVVQARAKPIQIAEATRKQLHSHRVAIHTELELPATAFADVVATLLLQQDVVLAYEGDRKQMQAVVFTNTGTPPEIHAQPVTVAQVLERPSRAAWVTTLVDTGDASVNQAFMFLRLQYVMVRGARKLQFEIEKEEEKIRLTGMTDQVAFAIKLLHSMYGAATATKSKMPDWDRTRAGKHTWPGNDLKRSELATLAGKELGCNLVLTGNPDEDPRIDLGKPAELSASDWFARLCAVLHEEELQLVPLVVEHGVFELRGGGVTGEDGGNMRKLFLTRDEALAQKHLLPVVTIVKPKGSSSDAANALRGLTMQRKGLSVGSCGPKNLVVSGPRDIVAQALQLVRDM